MTEYTAWQFASTSDLVLIEYEWNERKNPVIPLCQMRIAHKGKAFSKSLKKRFPLGRIYSMAWKLY